MIYKFQDNNIFDHTYFNFMWQMVQFLPTTLSKEADGAADDITLMSAKLATAFFLETFIHAKEKLNIVQWVEVLTKQLDSSGPACRWAIEYVAAFYPRPSFSPDRYCFPPGGFSITWLQIRTGR